MAILDFKEITEAHLACGQQDSFELFARDVLECCGFKIIQGPGIGADGGKDLIVKENRSGILGDSTIKWLVSCKHKAFSSKSVTLDEEKSILDRVSAAGCGAFLGFYSTIPSSALSDLLHKQTQIQYKIFDREEIERRLLRSPEGRHIITRYFPQSAKKMEHTPSSLYEEPVTIECDHCRRNLLVPPSGNVVFWEIPRFNENAPMHQRFLDLYFCCTGACDEILQRKMEMKNRSLPRSLDTWEAISDMVIPTVFMAHVMGIMNGLSTKTVDYDPPAFEKLKHLLRAIFPLVARNLNDNDIERLEVIGEIPSYFGGLG